MVKVSYSNNRDKEDVDGKFIIKENYLGWVIGWKREMRENVV